jgi:hypothetical protein
VTRKKKDADDGVVELDAMDLVAGQVLAANDGNFKILDVDPVLELPRGNGVLPSTQVVVRLDTNPTSLRLLSGSVTVVAA